MDDIERLTDLVKELPYPPGIRCALPGRILRPAFFPGGTGIRVGENPLTASPENEGRALPKRGVLVLGHNFWNVQNYEVTARNGGEVGKNPTWRELLLLLRDCGIDVRCCFFTNAFMGLLETESAVGSVRGHCDERFVFGCRRVLRESLNLQRTALVLALGPKAARFLGGTVPQLDKWAAPWSFSKFDSAGFFKYGLGLSLPGSVSRFAAVAILHPSLRRAHLGRRRFGELVGHQAEVAMVKRAMESVPDGRFSQD